MQVVSEETSKAIFTEVVKLTLTDLLEELKVLHKSLAGPSVEQTREQIGVNKVIILLEKKINNGVQD